MICNSLRLMAGRRPTKSVTPRTDSSAVVPHAPDVHVLPHSARVGPKHMQLLANYVSLCDQQESGGGGVGPWSTSVPQAAHRATGDTEQRRAYYGGSGRSWPAGRMLRRLGMRKVATEDPRLAEHRDVPHATGPAVALEIITRTSVSNINGSQHEIFPRRVTSVQFSFKGQSISLWPS
jgi:hypothetical protein